MAESSRRSSSRSRGARGSSGPAGSGRVGSPTVRTAQRVRTQSSARLRPDIESSSVAQLPRSRGRVQSTTQRVLAVAVLVAVLVILYGGTFNAFIHQQSQIAQAKQQIQDYKDSIASLEAEIERWNDPEYVKSQARERLGWVLPGETGFRVVGPDGQPYGGGQQIGAGTLPEGEYGHAWWDQLWGSVQTADDPVPATDDAAPITAPETSSEGG